MATVRLTELLGQPDVAAFLQSVVSGGRPGNAYLFHGPAGVGKGTAALAFARALMCEHTAGAPPAAPGLFDAAPAAAPAAPASDACGTCAACVKTAALQHPDLKLLFPLSGEEKTLEDTIVETLQSMRDDPFFTFQYEKAASIRMSMTRELLREMAYKPFECARRVVVVRDADRMREDQYSAMLKAIEEPGASTLWVLTTARLSRLPATIRSRCQRVRFAPLSESLVCDVLEQRLGLENQLARTLAALSGGSLARAFVLRQKAEEMDDDCSLAKRVVRMRDESLALVRIADGHDPAALWQAAQKTMRFGKAGRESLRRMVEFHMLWLRDVLRARHEVPREALVNRDREAEIREQAKRIDATEVRRRLMVLEEMLRAIEGNVTPELAMFSGLTRVTGSRVGEGAWPRHSTARWEY
jgi:DNA polymerase III subunit delta'